MRTRNIQKGFTLLELMVVVALIMLFSAFILSRLDTSRAKARDSQKVSELKALQNALELYQLQVGGYPKHDEGGVYKNNASDKSMADALQGVVAAGYLPSIPVPPKSSSVPGMDTYYYQTGNTSDFTPACNGKTLGEVSYIIYFITEQPANLPKLTNNGVEITNGHCLTL